MYVYRGGDLSEFDLTLIMDRPTAAKGTHIFASSVLSDGDPDGDGRERLLVAGAYYRGNVWLIDELYFDCDRDDVPDRQQLESGELEDCDADGIPDLCRAQMVPAQDCDANEVLAQISDGEVVESSAVESLRQGSYRGVSATPDFR